MADGDGGAIVVWMDARTTEGHYELFGQRIDSQGKTLWDSNGIPVCPGRGDEPVFLVDYGPTETGQLHPRMVPDGQGGAIITWCEGFLYAQRLGSDGEMLWGEEGVRLSATVGSSRGAKIAADGKGGAIVAWDARGEGILVEDIYVQRLDSDGNLLWGEDGLLVCSENFEQFDPLVVPDDTGGAIIAWTDLRNQQTVAVEVYCQRVDAMGNLGKGPGGIPICTSDESQSSPCMAPDGRGGAIVAWIDGRGGLETSTDIYAQRLDQDGDRRWDEAGVPICVEENRQENPAMAPDGSGGVIVGWTQVPPTDWENRDVFAQRVDSLGNTCWEDDGVAVSTSPQDQSRIRVTEDGGGGGYVTWIDSRYAASGIDIYGQHIDCDGSATWPMNGAPVCDAPREQTDHDVCPDGSGGMYAARSDCRNTEST